MSDVRIQQIWVIIRFVIRHFWLQHNAISLRIRWIYGKSFYIRLFIARNWICMRYRVQKEELKISTIVCFGSRDGALWKYSCILIMKQKHTRWIFKFFLGFYCPSLYSYSREISYSRFWCVNYSSSFLCLLSCILFEEKNGSGGSKRKTVIVYRTIFWVPLSFLFHE